MPETRPDDYAFPEGRVGSTPEAHAGNGLTKREWLAAQFAVANQSPQHCVVLADELIAWLNAAPPPEDSDA